MAERTVKASDAKFDILKIIMAFFVVAIHLDLFPTVLYPWLRMAVPLFFMMTGYFFFSKLDRTENEKAQRGLVKGFVLRNLKLYAFWFVCQLPLILFFRRDILFGHGFWGDVWAFVKCVLFGSTFTASWYIMASIYGVLILYFLLRKLPTAAQLVISFLLYLVVTLASSYSFWIVKNELAATLYHGFNQHISMPANSFLAAVPWLFCGKCFANHTFGKQKVVYPVLTVLSGVLLYLEWMLVKDLGGGDKNDCYLMLLPFCLGVFGWIRNAGPVSLRYSVNLRRCSTILFVTHGTIARTLLFFFRNVMHINPIALSYLIVSVVCVGIYLLIELLIARNKNNRLGRLLQYTY